jgi:Lon protease-like protein
MSSAEAFDRLPIFPLPLVQLFPHALLPLHIFEPRYRELLKDCLAGDRVMAIATLEPGYAADYEGRPPVRAICGVGRVIGHQPLPDGRANILLRGVTRARIVSELPPDCAYRLARLTPLSDRVAAGLDRAAAVQTLVLLADQIALRLPSGGETLRGLARSQPEPGPLVDVLSAALITDAGERQTLLELLDVAERVDRVTTRLATLLSGLERPPGTPSGAN